MIQAHTLWIILKENIKNETNYLSVTINAGVSFMNVIRVMADSTSRNKSNWSPQFAWHAPFSTLSRESDRDSTHAQLLYNVEV